MLYDLGRERLCRYLNRPAFSLARLRIRRDGNVFYRVKKATRGRVTQRVMTPIEALGRLAALVPPPRYPLLRFHGVLAPRHRWRDRVVPRPPARAPVCKGTPSELGPALEAGDGRAALVLPAPTTTLTTTGAAVQVAPNVLSIAHWDRILEGELYASGSRLDWRTLLKRTFDIHPRVCVRCGGRLLTIASVDDGSAGPLVPT